MSNSHPILPGSGLIGSGFNVFGRYDADSRTRPLLPTTNKDRTVSVGGKTYAVSDLIRVVDGADTQGEAHSFESREEVQKHFEAKAGVKTSIGGFSGEFSAHYGSTVRNTASHFYSLYEVSIQKWEMTLEPVSQDRLLPAVRQDPLFADLPESFTDETRHTFFALFQKYGTHVISSVRVGGRLYLYSSIKKTSVESTEEMRAKARAEYRALFSVAGEAETNWRTVGKRWTEERHVKLRAQGGSSDLVDTIVPSFRDNHERAFTSWRQSLDSGEVVPVELSLWPMSDLFSGARARAIERAIEAYTSNFVRLRSDEHQHRLTVNGRLVDTPALEPQAPLTPGLIIQTYRNRRTVQIAAIQAVVLSRADLQVKLNESFAYETSGTTIGNSGAYREYAHATDQLYSKLRVFAGDTSCLLAFTVSRMDANFKLGDLLAEFLRSAGAGEGLKEWTRQRGLACSWRHLGVNYTLLGTIGNPVSGIEVVEVGQPSYSPGPFGNSGSLQPIEELAILVPTPPRSQARAAKGSGFSFEVLAP